MIGTVRAETMAWGGLSAVLTQVIANNNVQFDTLIRHSPVKSDKYAAVLSVVIKEFENKF